MSWVPALVGTLVLVSFVTIGIMVVGLARDGMRLFRSGVDFVTAITPVLDDISQGAVDAQEKMASIQDRVTALGSKGR